MFPISTILKKVNVSNATTVISVVFVFVVSLFTALYSSGTSVVFLRVNGVSGGPHILAYEGEGVSSEASLISRDASAAENGDEASIPGMDEKSGSVVASAHPLLGTSTRDGLLIYTVTEGDTLSAIAENFNISVSTILWANSIAKTRALRIGEELVILPVSGVLHAIAENDTLSEIANIYNVPEENILNANAKINNGVLPAGERIIIPEGKPRTSTSGSVSAALPNLSGEFALPTTGFNWGELHARNAVDVANVCGTNVYAAAEGLVTRTGSPANWNSGYGGLVVIEHPHASVNNLETLYAHLKTVSVSLGDYVRKGQEVGIMGNTGNTHGPTGCHLHFEVHGAKNPLVK